jgi:hypothetical protein
VHLQSLEEPVREPALFDDGPVAAGVLRLAVDRCQELVDRRWLGRDRRATQDLAGLVDQDDCDLVRYREDFAS